MLRIRTLFAATFLLLLTAGVLMMVPAESSWQHASAQAAPKAAPGDRFFLKIDGVDGEAVETDHVGDLALRSFTWSETRTTDSSAKVQTKDFHAVMAFDKSSAVLMRKTALRERIAKVVLVARNSAGQDYLKWTMSDVILTSFALEGTTGQGKPAAAFDMNVGKMELEYRPQLYSGGLGPAVKTGWDAR